MFVDQLSIGLRKVWGWFWQVWNRSHWALHSVVLLLNIVMLFCLWMNEAYSFLPVKLNVFYELVCVCVYTHKRSIFRPVFHPHNQQIVIFIQKRSSNKDKSWLLFTDCSFSITSFHTPWAQFPALSTRICFLVWLSLCIKRYLTNSPVSLRVFANLTLTVCSSQCKRQTPCTE